MIFPSGLSYAERQKWVRENVLKTSTYGLEGMLAAQGIEATHTTVSRYEKGPRTPDIDYITALAEVSGVPLDWLVLDRAGDGSVAHVLTRLRGVLDEIEKASIEAGVALLPSKSGRLTGQTKRAAGRGKKAL